MTLLVADTPTMIDNFRLAALKGALSLELKGMRRSQSPSAYVILKRDYGYTGSRANVLMQVKADVDRLCGR